MSLPLEGQSLSANEISSTYLNRRLRYNYFRFWKTNVRHIWTLLPVSISTIWTKSAHYSATDYRISSKSMHPLWKYTVHFSRRWLRRLNTTSGFVFLMLPSEAQSIWTNQILWRYLYWRLRYNYFRFRNKRPPYWNSTFGFEIDQFAVICMLFCIRLPNFVQNGAPAAEIWRHTHFSRWRPPPLYTTSGFVFVDVAAFRKSKSISIPNFVQISRLAAEI